MQHTAITLERIKRANPTFFSKEAINWHGDIGYIVDAEDRTLHVLKSGGERVKYSIGDDLDLTYISD